MAQLRHDFPRFEAFNTEVLVMVPNGPVMIKRHRDKFNPPYPILTDKGARVAGQYFQVRHFFSFGTPTVFVVDQARRIRYALYAGSYIAEPDNAEALQVLAAMGGSAGAEARVP